MWCVVSYPHGEYFTCQDDSVDVNCEGLTYFKFNFYQEAQEKADKLNGVNEMVKPEIKVEYKKVECDIWNIATLKDDFEAGNLFRFDADKYDYEPIEKENYVASYLVNRVLYRRIETPVTLESELSELGFADGVVDDFGVWVSDEDENTIRVEFGQIHHLSAILKKYGK